jgi:hypothetical protein
VSSSQCLRCNHSDRATPHVAARFDSSDGITTKVRHAQAAKRHGMRTHSLKRFSGKGVEECVCNRLAR